MKIFKSIFFALIFVINKSFFYDPAKNVLSENEYRILTSKRHNIRNNGLYYYFLDDYLRDNNLSEKNKFKEYLEKNYNNGEIIKQNEEYASEAYKKFLKNEMHPKNRYIEVIYLFKERMLRNFNKSEMDYLSDILEKSNLLKEDIHNMELNSNSFAYFLEKIKECEFNFDEIKTILNNSDINYKLNKQYGDFIYYKLKGLKFTNEQIKSIINKDTQEFIYNIKEKNYDKFIELIKEWKINEWKINEIKNIFNHSVNNVSYSYFNEFINKIDNNFNKLKELKKDKILSIFNSEDPQETFNSIVDKNYKLKKNEYDKSKIKEYFNRQINNKYLTNDEMEILLKDLEISEKLGNIYSYIEKYINTGNYNFEKIKFIMNRTCKN